MTLFSKPKPPHFLRVLLIGSWATGKSHSMHTFPGLAVIDTQHGEASHFIERADKGEFPPFVTAEAATFEQAAEVIKAVIAGAAGDAQTLGIDSLTPLHTECVDRFTTTSQNGHRRTDWVAVKAIERRFGDLLRTVPKNVVATVEPRDVRARAGDKVNGKTVGAYDVVVAKESGNYDDSIGHKFDYVFKMRRDGNDSVATCLKAKDETRIARGSEIRNLTHAHLCKLLGLGVADNAVPEGQGITGGQHDEITELAKGLKIGSQELVDLVKRVSNQRAASLPQLSRAEAIKIIAHLQKRTNGQGAT